MLGKYTVDNRSSSVLNGKSCDFLLDLIGVAGITWEQKGGRTEVVFMLVVFENLCAACNSIKY